MADEARPNVFTDEWQRTMEEGGFGVRGTRVGALAGATRVGVTVYELDPGKKNLPYHAHFGVEEVIVVLRGTPVLRSPEGSGSSPRARSSPARRAGPAPTS